MIDIKFIPKPQLQVGDSVTLIINGGGTPERKEIHIVSKIDKERNIYLKKSNKVFNYKGEQTNEDTDTRFKRNCLLNLKNYSV